MRKLLIMAAAAVGVLTYRKWKVTEAEKSVWSKSTDTVD
ncbi:MAG: DLW-39 family protein [Arthrobacter sp.]